MNEFLQSESQSLIDPSNGVHSCFLKLLRTPILPRNSLSRSGVHSSRLDHVLSTAPERKHIGTGRKRRVPERRRLCGMFPPPQLIPIGSLVHRPLKKQRLPQCFSATQSQLVSQWQSEFQLIPSFLVDRTDKTEHAYVVDRRALAR